MRLPEPPRFRADDARGLVVVPTRGLAVDLLLPRCERLDEVIGARPMGQAEVVAPPGQQTGHRREEAEGDLGVASRGGVGTAAENCASQRVLHVGCWRTRVNTPNVNPGEPRRPLSKPTDHSPSRQAWRDEEVLERKDTPASRTKRLRFSFGVASLASSPVQFAAGAPRRRIRRSHSRPTAAIRPGRGQRPRDAIASARLEPTDGCAAVAPRSGTAAERGSMLSSVEPCLSGDRARAGTAAWQHPELEPGARNQCTLQSVRVSSSTRRREAVLHAGCRFSPANVQEPREVFRLGHRPRRSRSCSRAGETARPFQPRAPLERECHASARSGRQGDTGHTGRQTRAMTPTELAACRHSERCPRTHPAC